MPKIRYLFFDVRNKKEKVRLVSELLRTPLFAMYEKYGAKVVDFAGFAMPVQFAGIIKEHLAVRTQVGLFDVSHMGEILVEGDHACEEVDFLVTNDVTRLHPGQILYSPMCYEHGGTVDDVLVYCLAKERYMIVVNASNHDKDLAWITKHVNKSKVTDQTDQVALLALQGPKSIAVLSKVTNEDIAAIPYYQFKENITVCGVKTIVSRTGYTGEDGYELYVDAQDAITLFEGLLEAGKEEGIILAGLGARDTLRLEARLPLYGHELTEDLSPLEAGLAMFVKLDQHDFMGKTVLAAQKEQGVKKALVGLELASRSIARAGMNVLVDGQVIGFVSSGTFSPTLEKSIALAFVDPAYRTVGQQLHIEVRGNQVPATVVKTPFYRRKKENQ